MRLLPRLLVSLSPRLPVSPSPLCSPRFHAHRASGDDHDHRHPAGPGVRRRSDGPARPPREAATKATIVKLNAIIMQRYESYFTRRMPINPTTDPSGNPLRRTQIALDRLYAIRDIMRMEMPDRSPDIPTDAGAGHGQFNPPIVLPNSGQSVPIPALARLYHNRFTTNPPAAGGSNGQPNYFI